MVDRARELFGPELPDGYLENQMREVARQLLAQEDANAMSLGEFRQQPWL